jgi:Zn ribbon nucleic-acid-binding protein
MSRQKISPCPTCQSADEVTVYTYESGWRHVECLTCFYLGPGEGSILQAIKSHNERVAPNVRSIMSDEDRRAGV